MPKLVDYKGSRYEERETFIVGASKTIKAGNDGDFVVLDATISTRAAERAASTSKFILGQAVGFVTKEGDELTPAKAAALGASFDADTQTLITAADNVTSDKIKVVVNVHQDAVYLITASDTLGTTSGSDIKGNYHTLTDHDTLDETAVSATTGQLLSLGKVDSTHLLVKIVKSFKNMTSIA